MPPSHTTKTRNLPQAHDHGDHAHHDTKHAHCHAHDHDHDQANLGVLPGHDHLVEHDDHAAHDHSDHAHSHVDRTTPTSKLAIALALTSSFMVVEAFAGWISGSLALVADAGHMLSDAAALTVALVAQRIAARPRSRHRTFGSRRAEVLAAFINGVALVVSAIWIAREAVERLFSPHQIQGKWMLVTAVAGLVVNLISAWVLGSGHHENQNTRAAFAHVLSDALGSVGAIIAAILVLQFGWTRSDPVIGILIALLILWGAWTLVRQTLSVLMEGTPSHINVADLEATLKCVPGVCAVHDTHVWTISDGFDAVTAHVVLDGSRHGTEVVADGARLIWERFRIDHVTLQPEAPRPGLVRIRIPKQSKRKRDCE